MFNLRSAFGANLKLIRKSKNITQEKLAEMIDIHPRQLSKIETGEHFPTYKTIEKICISLKEQPKNLFNFEINFNDKTTPEAHKNSQQGINMDLMLNKFKKIATNEQYVKFLLLAMDSLNNKKSLEKLENLIEGIKLANIK